MTLTMNIDRLFTRRVRPLSRGFTLTEIIIVLIVMAILVSIGGGLLPDRALSNIAYRIEAERVATNIRWAQNYAISHAHGVIMLINDNQCSIYDDYDFFRPIKWPLVFGNCSENVCTLDSRVTFTQNIVLAIDERGGIIAYDRENSDGNNGSGTSSEVHNQRRSTFGSLYVFLPLVDITQSQANIGDLLYIVISKASGLVKVLNTHEVSNLR